MQSTRPENSSLKIDQHDRFFSKLLSKEVSAANSSSRILYYDGAVRAVPFLWETCPGTPKRLPPSSYSFDSADAYNFKPFLTPPPYYFDPLGSKSSGTGFRVKFRRGPRILSALLSMLGQKRSVMSPARSVSSSKSSLSSWSSSVASSPPLARKNKSYGERYALFTCSRFDGDEDDGQNPRSVDSERKFHRIQGMCV